MKQSPISPQHQEKYSLHEIPLHDETSAASSSPSSHHSAPIKHSIKSNAAKHITTLHSPSSVHYRHDVKVDETRRDQRRRGAIVLESTSTTESQKHRKDVLSPVVTTRRNAIHASTRHFAGTAQTSPNAVRSINSFEEPEEPLQQKTQTSLLTSPGHAASHPGIMSPPPYLSPHPGSVHHWPSHIPPQPTFHTPLYSPYSFIHPYAMHYPYPYPVPPQQDMSELKPAPDSPKQATTEENKSPSPTHATLTESTQRKTSTLTTTTQEPHEKPLFATLAPTKAVLKFQPRTDHTFKLSIHCAKGIYVHHSAVPKGTNPIKWNNLIKKIFFENEVDSTIAQSLPPSSCGFSWDEDKIALSIWLRDDVLNEKYEWKLKLRPTMRQPDMSFAQEDEDDVWSNFSTDDSLDAPHTVDKLMHSIFRVNNDVKKWQEKRDVKNSQLHQRLKQRRLVDADTITDDTASVQSINHFATMDIAVKQELLIMHDTVSELDRVVAQLKFDMHRQFTVFSSAFRENVDELRETVADMRSTALGLFQKCNELRDEVSMTSRSLQDHVSTTTTLLQQDIKQHKEQIDDLLNEDQNQRKRMKQLTITTDTRFKDVNDRINSKADIVATEKHIAEVRSALEKDMQSLTQRVESFEESFATEKEQLQCDISREVTAIQELRKEVDSRIVHLQNDVQSNLTLKNRKDETNLVNELMKQNKQLKENVTILTERLETKDADYAALQNKMVQMESQMGAILARLDKKVEEAPKSTNELEQQLQTQQDTIRELKAQIDLIQGDMVPLQSDNLNIKKRIFDLGVHVNNVQQMAVQKLEPRVEETAPPQVVSMIKEMHNDADATRFDLKESTESGMPAAEILHFHWSEEEKQMGVELDRLFDGAPVVRCIPKSTVRHPMSILGNIDLEEGQCYEWRLRVKEWDDKYRLWIGIADPRFSFSNFVGFFERTWSFELKDGKIYNGPTEKHYSKKHIGVGTVVSVIVDMRQTPGRIGFALDGEWLGWAFENLTLPLLPAMSFEGDATIAS